MQITNVFVVATIYRPRPALSLLARGWLTTSHTCRRATPPRATLAHCTTPAVAVTVVTLGLAESTGLSCQWHRLQSARLAPPPPPPPRPTACPTRLALPLPREALPTVTITRRVAATSTQAVLLLLTALATVLLTIVVAAIALVAASAAARSDGVVLWHRRCDHTK